MTSEVVKQKRDKIAEIAKFINARVFFEESNLLSLEKQIENIKNQKLLAT